MNSHDKVINSYDIADEYRAGATLQQLADKHGCAVGTIVTRLKAAGAPRRNRGNTAGVAVPSLRERNREIVALYASGKPCREIGCMYGLSYQRIAIIVARGC